MQALHLLLERKRIKITPNILRTVGDARPYGLQTDKTKKHKTPAVFTAEGDKLCIPIPFPKVTPQQA